MASNPPPSNNVQWHALCQIVADVMRVYTRPFVTALVADVPNKAAEFGTGSYIEDKNVRLLTCAHVLKHGPVEHQFYDRPELYPDPGGWHTDFAKDVAAADIPNALWSSAAPSARAVPRGLFAPKHAPVERELLFFRGLAGENAFLAFGGFERTLSGYCSQEVPGRNDPDIFEILWSPPHIAVTAGTDPAVRDTVRYNDAAGYSGSLVWNTRFVEDGCDLSRWSPQNAQVTGLLRRWDTTTASLLAWRVEHLLAWL